MMRLTRLKPRHNGPMLATTANMAHYLVQDRVKNGTLNSIMRQIAANGHYRLTCVGIT